jgi:hypothetical protein
MPTARNPRRPSSVARPAFAFGRAVALRDAAIVAVAHGAPAAHVAWLRASMRAASLRAVLDSRAALAARSIRRREYVPTVGDRFHRPAGMHTLHNGRRVSTPAHTAEVLEITASIVRASIDGHEYTTDRDTFVRLAGRTLAAGSSLVSA